MLLEIKATLKTPQVTLDFEKGEIILAGISIPEDPYSFYSPVDAEIDKYLESPLKTTNLQFKLEYFNTSSTLIIRNLIRKLYQNKDKTTVNVKWFYEEYDEDMKEAGEEFKLLFNQVNFELFEVPEFKS
jgi:response regulator RpfG family c-di-GMP phosphodiesterase